MGRIRTIKPEFFTSEDVVSLSPLARLLFIAVWCEADREGRLVWKPRTLKIRYFPADDCDITALCDELVVAELVVLYGEGRAYVPSFKRHQHVNPREAASTLPDPDACPTRAPRVSTRVNPDGHAQGGKERKGKEGVDDASSDAPDEQPTAPPAAAPAAGQKKQGTRLPEGWQLPEDWREWCAKHRPDLDPQATAEAFSDYWHAKPGKDASKLDWFATWRNWCRNQRQPPGSFPTTLGSGGAGRVLSSDHVFTLGGDE